MRNLKHADTYALVRLPSGIDINPQDAASSISTIFPSIFPKQGGEAGAGVGGEGLGGGCGGGQPSTINPKIGVRLHLNTL